MAVNPPVVVPPAPADAAGDNNAQNANHNVVPVPQPAAPEVSVFPVLVFVWLSFRLCVIGFSFRVCAARLLLSSVYKVTVFACVFMFSRLCYNLRSGVGVQVKFLRLCDNFCFFICVVSLSRVCVTNFVFHPCDTSVLQT